MRQRSLLQSVLLVALFGAVTLVAAGCGGGGKAGTGSLYLQKFLLVDQNLNNIGGTGATNAYRNTRILFVFSQPVDSSTVSIRTIRIGIPTEPGLFKDAVGRFAIVDGHPNWVLFDPTFTPNNQTDVHDNPFGLDANSTYEVHIPSAADALKHVVDQAGKGIALSFDGSFETTTSYIQDFKQPEVVGSEPADGQTDVNATSDVLVHFSDAMNPNSFGLQNTIFVRVRNALKVTVNPDTGAETPSIVNRDVLGTLLFSTDAKTVTFRPVFGFGKGLLEVTKDPNDPNKLLRDTNGVYASGTIQGGDYTTFDPKMFDPAPPLAGDALMVTVENNADGSASLRTYYDLSKVPGTQVNPNLTSADPNYNLFVPTGTYFYVYHPFQVLVSVSTGVTNLPGNPIPRAYQATFYTRPDPTQPDFGDIKEDFSDNSQEDTTYTPTNPRAAWNSGVTSGYLAGVFTTGTVTISPATNTITYNPFSWGNSFAAQTQALYLSGEIGGERTITGFDWHYANYVNGTSVTQMTVNLGHATVGDLTVNFSQNYSEPPISVVSNLASYVIPATPSQGWLPGPTFTQNFKYNGNDNLIIEILCTNASANLNTGTTYSGAWYSSTGDPLYRTAYTQPGGSPQIQQWEHDIAFHYLIDLSDDQSKWYDSGLSNAQYLDPILTPAMSAQPAGTETTLEFQGAPPEKLTGGTVDPDLSNLSPWTSDITQISNYRFFRFRVTFRGNTLTGTLPSYDSFDFLYIYF